MTILEFNGGMPNISVEVNDLIYYVSNVQNQWQNQYMSSPEELQQGVSTHVFLGVVASIITDVDSENNPIFKIVVEEPSDTAVVPPSANDYIFFIKNNNVEVSSLKGYYSTVVLENNSSKPAELFSVACDVVESSK